MSETQGAGSLKQWLKGLASRVRTSSVVRVVVGNEASDLDSMASSLTYAWLEARRAGENDPPVVPVMNIPREDFPLRTEAVWLFREAGVEVEELLFLDDVDLAALHAQGRLRLVLVDHNRLPARREAWGPAVEEILDHHEDEGLYAGASKTIAPVGSAATLVAERLLAERPQGVDAAAATLLLGTILLDTVNLDPAAKRVTPRDEQAAAALLEATKADRRLLFDRLQAEKFNVSALSSRDILRKDYKEYTMGTVKCGISSALLPLGDWLRKDPQLEGSFAQYARSRNLDLLLAMCAYTQPEFRRELAVYAAEGSLAERVVAFLDSRGLGLSPLRDESAGGLRCYAQADVSQSRKKLQPLLAGLLEGQGSGTEPAGPGG